MKNVARTLILAVVAMFAVSCTEDIEEPLTVESVSIDRNELNLKVGETASLSFSVLPAEARWETAQWNSESEDIATVDDKGVVTAVAEGETRIVLAVDGVEAYCKVSVGPVPVEKVILNREALSVMIGESATLEAQVLPENASHPEVEWSVDRPEIVSLEKGVVTGLAIGEAVVTVKAEEQEARCVVTVTKVPVESVKIVPNTIKIQLGSTYQLESEVSPENATDAAVAWASLNPEIATVNAEGLVEAVAIGETSIKADAGGKEGWCSVVVTKVPVESVVLNETEFSLFLGDTFQMSAEIVPANATYPDIVWSSDNPATVSVSEDGLLEALLIGEATISAVADGVVSKCTVTVKEIPVESITLNYTEYSLEKYKKVELIATVAPENATDQYVIWSTSDAEIANVLEGGIVSAYEEGEVDITAKCGGKTAVCHITVTRQKATRIFITPEIVTISPEGTYQLKASAFAEGWIEDAIIDWKSDNEAVATVSAEGLVTGIADGTANVIASCDGVADTCAVTVESGGIKKDWTKYELFDVEGYGQGIVVYVAKDQSYIKIMSLTSSSEAWAVDASIEVGYKSSYKDKDGRTGSAKLAEAEALNPGNFPAYEWCIAQGEDWYMPAYQEVEDLMDYNTRKKINETLSAAGYLKIPDDANFWTNGEGKQSSKAAFWNCSYGYMGEISKTMKKSVFAMKRIELQ